MCYNFEAFKCCRTQSEQHAEAHLLQSQKLKCSIISVARGHATTRTVPVHCRIYTLESVQGFDPFRIFFLLSAGLNCAMAVCATDDLLIQGGFCCIKILLSCYCCGQLLFLVNQLFHLLLYTLALCWWQGTWPKPSGSWLSTAVRRRDHNNR